jgi:hypothetical protein
VLFFLPFFSILLDSASFGFVFVVLFHPRNKSLLNFQLGINFSCLISVLLDDVLVVFLFLLKGTMAGLIFD